MIATDVEGNPVLDEIEPKIEMTEQQSENVQMMDVLLGKWPKAFEQRVDAKNRKYLKVKGNIDIEYAKMEGVFNSDFNIICEEGLISISKLETLWGLDFDATPLISKAKRQAEKRSTEGDIWKYWEEKKMKLTNGTELTTERGDHFEIFAIDFRNLTKEERRNLAEQYSAIQADVIKSEQHVSVEEMKEDF